MSAVLMSSAFPIELRVGPAGMLPNKQIADVIVLLREQRVQHRESDPPVLGESAQMNAGVRIDGQQFRRFEFQLAALAGSKPGRDDRVGAVDLRTVPPMPVRVRVRRRTLGPWGGRIGSVRGTLRTGSDQLSPGTSGISAN